MRFISLVLLTFTASFAAEMPERLTNALSYDVQIKGVYSDVESHLNKVAESELWQMNINDVFWFIMAEENQKLKKTNPELNDFQRMGVIAEKNAGIYSWIDKNYKERYKEINKAAIKCLMAAGK